MQCARNVLLLDIVCYCVSLAMDTIIFQANAKLSTNEFLNYNSPHFEEFDEIVGSSQFVNFGESAYGLVGMHHGATRIFRCLVEKKGFRVFVFEPAWTVDEATQTFLEFKRSYSFSWLLTRSAYYGLQCSLESRDSIRPICC